TGHHGLLRMIPQGVEIFRTLFAFLAPTNGLVGNAVDPVYPKLVRLFTRRPTTLFAARKARCFTSWLNCHVPIGAESVTNSKPNRCCAAFIRARIISSPAKSWATSHTPMRYTWPAIARRPLGAVIGGATGRPMPPA